MRVNKLIMVLTAGMLLYMSATAHYGISNGVDLFINHELSFTYLRLSLIGALAVLFFTEVPRSIATRFFTGIIAAALFGANGYFLLENAIPIMDGMMFGLVAIILAIEALEYEPQPKVQLAKR